MKVETEGKSLRKKSSQSLLSTQTKNNEATEIVMKKITMKDQDHLLITEEIHETTVLGVTTKEAEEVETMETSQEEEIENGKMINIEIQIDKTTIDRATDLPGSILRKIIEETKTILEKRIIEMIEDQETITETIIATITETITETTERKVIESLKGKYTNILYIHSLL
jgi:hypothetical protein